MIVEILLTVLLMLVFHEILHYLPLVFYKVDFEYFVLAKKNIGFIVENSYMRENKKLAASTLLPLALSLTIIIDPNDIYIFTFSFLNLIWSIMDIVTFYDIKRRDPDKRVKWADEWDEDLLDNAIFKKKLK